MLSRAPGCLQFNSPSLEDNLGSTRRLIHVTWRRRGGGDIKAERDQTQFRRSSSAISLYWVAGQEATREIEKN